MVRLAIKNCRGRQSRGWGCLCRVENSRSLRLLLTSWKAWSGVLRLLGLEACELGGWGRLEPLILRGWRCHRGVYSSAPT